MSDGRRLWWTLAGVVGTLLVASPFAIAASGGGLVGGARNPSRGVLKKTTTIQASNSKYGMSLSNRASNGGGLLIACKSHDGGTPAGQEPCLRSANSSGGRAFEFAFTGTLGGIFQVGPDINQPFTNVAPFITNALGVATGLNADRVDGLHAQDIITAAVDKASVKVGAQGSPGPQGPRGAQGPEGPQGAQGASGLPLKVAAKTAANAGRGGKRVVALTKVAVSSLLPAVAADGAALVNPVSLNAGTYMVSVNLRAYDLDSANSGNAPAYAVASLFLGDANQGTLTTAQIPSDGNNAAQTSETVVVTVPAGGGTLSLQGVVRTSAPAPVAGDNAEAGADLVITEVGPVTP